MTWGQPRSTREGVAAAFPSSTANRRRHPGVRPNVGLALAMTLIPLLAGMFTGVLAPGIGVLALGLLGVVFLSEALLPVGARRPLLSMRPLVGILGSYMLFVAPMVTLAAGPWLRFVQVPPDIAEALDTHLALGAAGAILYKVVVVTVDDRPLSLKGIPGSWSSQRFWVVWRLLVGISAVSYLVLAFRVGPSVLWLGDRAGVSEGIRGLGAFVFIADWLPLLLGVGTIVSYRERGTKRNYAYLQLTGVFALSVFMSGWRGSRGSILWPLVTLVVLWVLLHGPLRKKTLWLLVTVAGALLVLFGYFKVGGVETVVAVVAGQEDRAAVDQRTGRGIEGVLRGDLDRTSAQALLLNRLSRPTAGELALGTTYLAAPLELIPDAFGLSNAGLVRRGDLTSSLIFDQRSQDLRVRTSRAFGMQGEAYINFGLAGGVLVFAPFGVLAAVLSRGYRAAVALRSIPRALLVSAFVAPCLVLLPFEMDVALGYFIKVSIPLALLALAARNRTGTEVCLTTAGHGGV